MEHQLGKGSKPQNAIGGGFQATETNWGKFPSQLVEGSKRRNDLSPLQLRLCYLQRPGFMSHL